LYLRSKPVDEIPLSRATLLKLQLRDLGELIANGYEMYLTRWKPSEIVCTAARTPLGSKQIHSLAALYEQIELELKELA
jgi:hypothetical protein